MITRFGKPVAHIVPPEPPKPHRRKLGGLAHSIQIAGDIVSPPDENPEPPEVRW